MRTKSKFKIIIFFAIVFGITACNNANNTQGAHTHEDGTECKESHSDRPEAPEQERFKTGEAEGIAAADSVKHEHNHNSGHDCDGHDHKH